MNSQFKNENTFELRKSKSELIRKHFKDRIPVICEKHEDSELFGLLKPLFLVPFCFTIAQLVYFIRQKINLIQKKPLFVYINGILPPKSLPIYTIYDKHKDLDGFLYFSYSSENFF